MKNATWMGVSVAAGMQIAVACAAPGAAGDAIRQGVKEIAAPGTPGNVLLWGPGAEVVVCGGARAGRECVVGVGTLGRGRIVAFGHTGYGDAGAMDVADTKRLMLNAVRWAGGEHDLTKERVATLGGSIGEVLGKEGLAVELIEKGDLARAVGRDRVLCLFREDLSEAQVAAVTEFIRAGGGLVTAQTGWGWRQIHAGKPLRENAINRIMSAAGMAFGDGTPDAKGGRYGVTGEGLELVNASQALDAIVAQGDKTRTLHKEELRQAEAALSSVARSLPKEDRLLRPRLDELLAAKGRDLEPTEKAPIRSTDALSRALLAMQVERLMEAPADEVRAHPAARVFPGEVPADAARVTREVEIDAAVRGWHSTGLYAAPGEVVGVEVLEGDAAGWTLQIGLHTDELWHHDAWKRVPRIVRDWKIGAGVTRAASAFGGLVYVEVPRKGAGRVKVRIGNVVEAPRFVLGKTDGKEWLERIRQAPGPWAELATDKVIVTVPSRLVRDLEDPAALMGVWDKVLDAAADLAAIPRERERPQRYVADVQISAGYMHSGYPIMTHLDAAEAMASREKMLAGQWGLFHELGHNHQEGDWTFAGTGEVTCNLFSLYIMETVCGRAPAQAHEANDKTSERIARYFEKPASLERWHADPFTALVMYRQMREAFGWEVYQKVFAEYRALGKDERPRSDEEKRDEWMVRMSRATGRNLGPFFEAWGVTTSAAARESVKGLEGWMAEGFPPRK